MTISKMFIFAFFAIIAMAVFAVAVNAADDIIWPITVTDVAPQTHSTKYRVLTTGWPIDLKSGTFVWDLSGVESNELDESYRSSLYLIVTTIVQGEKDLVEFTNSYATMSDDIEDMTKGSIDIQFPVHSTFEPVFHNIEIVIPTNTITSNATINVKLSNAQVDKAGPFYVMDKPHVIKNLDKKIFSQKFNVTFTEIVPESLSSLLLSSSLIDITTDGINNAMPKTVIDSLDNDVYDNKNNDYNTSQFDFNHTNNIDMYNTMNNMNDAPTHQPIFNFNFTFDGNFKKIPEKPIFYLSTNATIRWLDKQDDGPFDDIVNCSFNINNGEQIIPLVARPIFAYGVSFVPKTLPVTVPENSIGSFSCLNGSRVQLARLAYDTKKPITFELIVSDSTIGELQKAISATSIVTIVNWANKDENNKANVKTVVIIISIVMIVVLLIAVIAFILRKKQLENQRQNQSINDDLLSQGEYGSYV